MKTIVLGAIAITSALSLFAQGTVLFNNRVPNVATSHVYWGPFYRSGNGSADVPPGPTDYTGWTLIGTVGGMSASTTFATLLGAPGSNAPESLMQPSLTPPTTFRTGLGAGNIVPNTATFANIPPDAAVATFEMVVWDNSSGLFPTWTQARVGFGEGLTIVAASVPFTVQSIGGFVNTPPNIVSSIPGRGVQSFSFLIPEPTSLALAGLGAAALLISHRRKYSAVDAQSNLVQPNSATPQHSPDLKWT